MNGKLILGALCGLAVLGGVAYALRDLAAEKPMVADVTTEPCQLQETGGLDRVDEVRFFQRYADPFGTIVGVHLSDTLQDACATLAAAGFTESHSSREVVELRRALDNGDPNRVSRFTNHIQMDGTAVNPFEDTLSAVRVILTASSPATYSSVERISALFDYTSPPTLEEWAAQMTVYLGPPSETGPSGAPLYWVVSKNALDTRGPDTVCDKGIVDYTQRPLQLPRPIHSVPAHDGLDCQLLIIADFYVTDDTPPGRIGRVGLDFVDYAAIASNRRKENQAIEAIRSR